MMAHKAVTSQERLKEAAEKLNVGMGWVKSVEGHAFWQDVFERLNVYADGGMPAPLGKKAAGAEAPKSFADQARARIAALGNAEADSAQTEKVK